jgi:hypothetical protein
MYFHPLLSIQYVKFLWKGIFNSQLKLIIIVEIYQMELPIEFHKGPDSRDPIAIHAIIPAVRSSKFLPDKSERLS